MTKPPSKPKQPAKRKRKEPLPRLELNQRFESYKPAATGMRSSYTPDACRVAVELGKQGLSLISICAELGITQKTLGFWREQYPEFDDAVEMSMILAQNELERVGLTGMKTKGIDSNIWGKTMSCRFPAHWRENKGIEVANKEGEVFKVDAKVNVVDLVNRIRELAQEEDKG